MSSHRRRHGRWNSFLQLLRKILKSMKSLAVSSFRFFGRSVAKFRRANSDSVHESAPSPLLDSTPPLAGSISSMSGCDLEITCTAHSTFYSYCLSTIFSTMHERVTLPRDDGVQSPDATVDGVGSLSSTKAPDTSSSAFETALSSDSSSPNFDTALSSHTCISTRTGSTTTFGSCSTTTSGSTTTTASSSTSTSSWGTATSLPINATTSSVNKLATLPAMFQTQIMRVFGIDEIMAATNNFSCDNLLGGGAFGKVYRGQFANGEVVAVKKLIKTPERLCDFFSEYGIMAHLHHPNILTLLGSCHEEGLHLVLQFASRGSLASLIRDKKCSFGWEHRYKVALGVAKGLLYLHQGTRRRVIHMDIKLQNIVVGEDYEPKIADFGTAVWLPHGESHIVDAKLRGTVGYMPPEYLHKRIICEKNDVYAFGVLLLELLSGRRASTAMALFQNGKVEELIDPRLGSSYSMEQVTKIMKVASMCTKYINRERRPEMDKVVQLLAQ